jgi:plastocyanin
MTRTTTIRAGALALAALAALAITTAAPAHGVTTTITISHTMRGCHMWQVGSGQKHPSLSVTIKAGTALKFLNNDVMPHKLLQTSGAQLRFAHANMNHMSASTSVKFAKSGIYKFTTRAGEDYRWVPEMHTMGKDYVLHLTVLVK